MLRSVLNLDVDFAIGITTHARTCPRTQCVTLHLPPFYWIGRHPLQAQHIHKPVSNASDCHPQCPQSFHVRPRLDFFVLPFRRVL
jgi:hypothetical protein